MMKTTVIHHSADFDGIFCREIARKFLPNAELIGWDYGQPTPLKGQLDGSEKLYILDLSIDDLMDHPNLVWIDHHKSAIDKYADGVKRNNGKSSIAGYRIDGVAACRLAWQHFCVGPDFSKPDWKGYPDKQAFINRTVREPLAVRLVGEYDIWDRRDPRAELFQHGLRSRELTPEIWDTMLGNVTENSTTVDTLLQGGTVLQYARTHENASVIKELGFTFKWEGLTFLCCNAARYNSHLFTAGLTPEHDACFGFKWTGKDWSVSLYHAPGKEHHDLSLIAVKHGGGGHRGACGFRAVQLPFLIGI